MAANKQPRPDLLEEMRAFRAGRSRQKTDSPAIKQSRAGGDSQSPLDKFSTPAAPVALASDPILAMRAAMRDARSEGQSERTPIDTSPLETQGLALVVMDATVARPGGPDDGTGPMAAAQLLPDSSSTRETPTGSELAEGLQGGTRPTPSSENSVVLWRAQGGGGLQRGSTPQSLHVTPSKELEAIRGTLLNNDSTSERLIGNVHRCRQLIDALGDEAEPIMAPEPGSRLHPSSETLEVYRIQEMLRLGGKNCDAMNQLRLCLKDWKYFLTSALDDGSGLLFPITGTDAKAFRASLIENGQGTAAKRVAPALSTANALGLDAPLINQLDVPTSEKGTSARFAPPPIMLVDLDRSSRGDVKHIQGPKLQVTRTTYVNLMLGGRGGDHQASRYPDFKESGDVHGYERGLLRSCTNDKLGRSDVLHYSPLEGFLTETLEWIEPHITELKPYSFTVPDFGTASPSGEMCGKFSLAKSTGFIKDEMGNFTYCHRRKMLAAMAQVVPLVTGKPIKELRGMNLTGTHTWRHMAATITSCLQWPDVECRVCGDWAPELDLGSAGTRVAARKKAAAGVGSTAQTYAAHYSPPRQMAIRSRYFAAVRLAFKEFGVERVTWETTWKDIIPEAASAEMKPFYGSAVNHTSFFPKGLAEA